MAKAASNTDDNKLAIEYFDKAITQNPNKPEYYLFRGISNSRIDKMTEAIDDFNKAKEINPKYAKAYQNLADVKIRLKDYHGALLEADTAVKYATNEDGYEWVIRAKAKQALNDTSGALADYTASIRVNAKNADGYTGRGDIKSMMMDNKGALTDLNKAIELYPSNSYAYSVRGRVKTAMGDIDGAIQDYKKQVELDPKNQEASLRLSQVLIANRQFKDAVLILNKIITPDTKNGKLYIQRGIAYNGLGDSNGAIEQFDEAIAVDSTTAAIAYCNRANTKLGLKDYDGTAKDIAKAIEKDQSYDEIYFVRANLKMTQNKYEGAVADYFSVLLLNPQNTKIYAYRALAESFTADTAGMNADFNEAIKDRPKDDNVYILRGKAKINLKDPNGAVRDFTLATRVRPIDYDAWYNLGFEKLIQKNSAGCADLKKAVDLGSKEAVDVVKKYCK